MKGKLNAVNTSDRASEFNGLMKEGWVWGEGRCKTPQAKSCFQKAPPLLIGM